MKHRRGEIAARAIERQEALIVYSGNSKDQEKKRDEYVNGNWWDRWLVISLSLKGK